MLEDNINEIQKLLNNSLNDTKKSWAELQKNTSHLKAIQEKAGDMQLGGIKISELNDSLLKMTKFLEGAFGEVTKSLENIGETTEAVKTENKEKDGNV
jgi:hypothetical protein